MLAKTKKTVEHNLTKASEVASLARKEFDMGECTSKTQRRFGPKLATLQAERTTYTIDPTHADYASYRESFVADDKTAEITELLDTVPAMGAYIYILYTSPSASTGYLTALSSAR